MDRNRQVAVAQVAATYAGTIIGAGFASGQEVVQFFAGYGEKGLWGVAVAGVLFALLGGRILELGFKLKASAYHHVMYHVCGRRVGFFLDITTAVFLFASLAIMLAGSATVFRDYFHIPYAVGLGIMALLTAATVFFGVGGITLANMVVTPILVVTILFISFFSLSYHDFSPPVIEKASLTANPLAPHWLLGALLYVSYNLVIGSTVLVPLGRSVASRTVRLIGGAAGGVILGLLAAFITLVVQLHYPQVLRYEVPILQIASAQYSWSSFLYSLTLLAAMYTTAIASLYGCTTKIEATTGLGPMVGIIIVTGLALACSQLGFATLIKLLFPLFGYATLCFTVRLAWLWIRDR